MKHLSSIILCFALTTSSYAQSRLSVLENIPERDRMPLIVLCVLLALGLLAIALTLKNRWNNTTALRVAAAEHLGELRSDPRYSGNASECWRAPLDARSPLFWFMFVLLGSIPIWNAIGLGIQYWGWFEPTAHATGAILVGSIVGLWLVRFLPTAAKLGAQACARSTAVRADLDELPAQVARESESFLSRAVKWFPRLCRSFVSQITGAVVGRVESVEQIDAAQGTLRGRAALAGAFLLWDYRLTKSLGGLVLGLFLAHFYLYPIPLPGGDEPLHVDIPMEWVIGTTIVASVFLGIRAWPLATQLSGFHRVMAFPLLFLRPALAWARYLVFPVLVPALLAPFVVILTVIVTVAIAKLGMPKERGLSALDTMGKTSSSSE